MMMRPVRPRPLERRGARWRQAAATPLRLTGTAAFSLADYRAVFVQGETGDDTVTAGVRVGALPGLIAGGLAAAIGALAPRT